MNRKNAYLLFLILVFAFIIRVPKLDFPSIGYHNLKENENISIAKNMLAHKDYISRDIYFYNAFTDKKDFGLYPQIPLVAYQIVLGYRLFGDYLWPGRLINVFLMLLSVVAIFYLTNLLSEGYGLAAAALLSILPLGVYFSRNLQPESGGFFFMTLGSLLFIKFMEKFKLRYLAGFTLCLFMVAAYKISFLFGFIPLSLIFPYRQYIASRRKLIAILKEILFLAFPLLVLFVYYIAVGQFSFEKGRAPFFAIFTFSYWHRYGSMIWYYALNENFTPIYLILFISGVAKSWLNYQKDKGLFARYLRAFSLAAIVYFVFFSDYVNQHNYYQMPLLGFACLSIVYCLRELSGYLTNIFSRRIKPVAYFVFIFLLSLLLAFSGIKRSILSHFMMIFPGTDSIGGLLKDITAKEERIFIYTFPQGLACCVYAERKCGWPDSLRDLKLYEQKFGIRYMVIYPYVYMESLPQDFKDYIKDNYRIKFMGATLKEKELSPQVIVLERGGVLDMQQFFNKSKATEKGYQTARGYFPFYIFEDSK